jgi:anti-sigma factor RsiW
MDMMDSLDPAMIHAYVDRELDLARQLEFEKAMERDETLRALVAELRSQRLTIQTQATYHAAPDNLRRRITALAGTATTAASSPAPRRADAPRRPSTPLGSTLARWLDWRPLSAAVAATLVVGFGAQIYLASQQKDDRIADEVLASHVRSTLGSHLIDVSSADHHTVKPYLSSKLDFSPPVRDADLGTNEFVGGRVDYVDGHPVAALVYRSGKHVVNDFVWPSKEANRDPKVEAERGYQIAHWTRDGMTHWTISDVSRGEFDGLVKTLASRETPVPETTTR